MIETMVRDCGSASADLANLKDFQAAQFQLLTPSYELANLKVSVYVWYTASSVDHLPHCPITVVKPQTSVKIYPTSRESNPTYVEGVVYGTQLPRVLVPLPLSRFGFDSSVPIGIARSWNASAGRAVKFYSVIQQDSASAHVFHPAQSPAKKGTPLPRPRTAHEHSFALTRVILKSPGKYVRASGDEPEEARRGLESVAKDEQSTISTVPGAIRRLEGTESWVCFAGCWNYFLGDLYDR
ncbi:hypothetical protein FB451DRAFT_1163805 [Mycena latifolia]|nr:hypothetical protein FB451DRAFT_1163805 [Mycena latifolia]